MNNNKNRTLISGLFVVAFFLPGLPSTATAMDEISDDSLAAITGQALLVADKILPNSLPCASPDGSCTATTGQNITFYRVGLDVKMAMNLNIDKLQLGCGGINDSLAVGCDIDLDYVRFMGNASTYASSQVSTDGITQYGAGAAATSDFTLTRPYLELAIKNDGSKTQREVIGIKIGAQTANGYLSAGSYNTSTGANTGINMVSAYLNAYLSGWVQVQTSLGNGTACIGHPDFHASQCGAVSNTGNPNVDIPANGYNIPWFRTSGTRMSRLQVAGAPLHDLQGTSGLISLLNGSTLDANLDLDMNMLHGIGMFNTADFYISMQRQRINWPKYDKSGYGMTANTGWWMNVPTAAVLDVFPPPLNLGCPGGFLCLGMLAAFAYPGLGYSNPDLGSRPVSNCYGTSLFC